MRELAADAALRPRVGRAVRRARARRRRRARAGVRVRARPRQRAPRRRPSSGVGYPVVIDNDFAIWQSFGNHAWPALYLVDREGRLRFRHFGEEAYEETERAVQQLLGVDEALVDVEAGGLAEAADWHALRSPETYVAARAASAASTRRRSA